MGGHTIFLKGRVAKMSILGWLDVYWAVHLGLLHFCVINKQMYVFSLSSVDISGALADPILVNNPKLHLLAEGVVRDNAPEWAHISPRHSL